MSVSARATGPPRAHVLALDDHYQVLRLFDDLLREEGYRVTTRVWAGRTLPDITAIAPDLILLDYQWATEDDGWSLLQMLRVGSATSKIPIVLCTGAISHVQETQGQLEEMGIEVLPKPFDLDLLLRIIERSLGTMQEGRQSDVHR